MYLQIVISNKAGAPWSSTLLPPVTRMDNEIKQRNGTLDSCVEFQISRMYLEAVSISAAFVALPHSARALSVGSLSTFLMGCRSV